MQWKLHFLERMSNYTASVFKMNLMEYLRSVSYVEGGRLQQQTITVQLWSLGEDIFSSQIPQSCGLQLLPGQNSVFPNVSTKLNGTSQFLMLFYSSSVYLFFILSKKRQYFSGNCSAGLCPRCKMYHWTINGFFIWLLQNILVFSSLPVFGIQVKIL